MYTLTNNGSTLFDPRIQECSLENPMWILEANMLGTLSFTIYPNNPEYNKITKTGSYINVYLDGELMQILRPVSARAGFRGGIEYQCEELGARLNDVLKRPAVFEGTVTKYITTMVNEYNNRMAAVPETVTTLGSRVLRSGSKGSDVAEMQRYLIGLGYSCGKWGADGIFGSATKSALTKWQKAAGLSANGVLSISDADVLIQAAQDAGIIPAPRPAGEVDYPLVVGNITHAISEKIRAVNTEYVGFYDELQYQLVENLGGYIIFRYQDDSIYLDYLGEEDLPESGQEIRFAENMVDLILENDTSETFSVLIPLGDPVDTGSPIEELESLPLTIASVNGGKDYLESSAGIELYGRREHYEIFEGVTDANELKRKGQTFLNRNAIALSETITLTAADRHNMDFDVDALRWMTLVRAYSEVHGIDEKYPLANMTVPLANPTSTDIQLGSTKSSLTDRISGGANNSTAEITIADTEKVPFAKMTGYTGSDCVVSASSEYSARYRAWMAFDYGTSASWASTASDAAPWLQIEMPDRMVNITVYVYSRSSSYVHNPLAGRILGSEDGETWTEIGTYSGWSRKARSALLGTIECGNSETPYRYVRFAVDQRGGNEGYVAVGYIYITGNPVIGGD